MRRAQRTAARGPCWAAPLLLLLLLLAGCEKPPPPGPTPEQLTIEQQRLVYSQLARRRIDGRILAQMGRFPRHRLLPEGLRAQSYHDAPLKLSDGTLLWSPTQVAQVLTQLAPKRGQRALVMGGGEGWAAALLASLGLEVTLWEPSPARRGALGRALSRIEDPGYEPAQLHLARSERAALARAPFERILILGALAQIPQPWLDALAPDDGRLVGPEGLPGETALLQVDRRGGEFVRTSLSRGRYPFLYPHQMLNYAQALHRAVGEEGR